MKKSVLFLTAALSFGVAAAQQAPAAPAAAQVPTLTDVPAGHWAKDAIDRLVARGVLLGYPDGTFRGTQNLTRYEAAVIIARLLNQMGNGQAAGLDAETLTSLQNAVQELSADLAALGVRVNDLEENAVSKEDFNRLEERVEALDGSDLKGLAGRYDELSANYDTLRADVDDNASSIAALNDLTVLLNQDILNLQDRASALEAAQADFVTRTDFDALNSSVKSIDGRVTTLENAPKFSIGGSIEAKYGRFALNSDSTAGNFDIDRLTANTFIGNYFSDDDYCALLGPDDTYGAKPSVARRKLIRCVDTDNDFTDFKTTVTLGASGLKTANGAVNINAAHITLMADDDWHPTHQESKQNNYVSLTHLDITGSTADKVKFTVNYDNGNDSNSRFKFNDYLFANANDSMNIVYHRGIVASVDASKAYPWSPQVTVVAGSATPRVLSKAGYSNDNAYPNTPLVGNYYGLRLAFSPTSTSTLALSYAKGNATTKWQRDAAGLDGKFKAGPLNINGAFVASYLTNAVDGANFNNADKAAFIEVGLEKYYGLSFKANYRYIDPAFEDGIAGISTSDARYYSGLGGTVNSDAPYGSNENGFGIDASYEQAFFKLGAYVNSFKSTKTDAEIKSHPPYAGYSNKYDNISDRRQTAWGVRVGSPVWRGSSLTAFFNNAQLYGQKIARLYGNNTSGNNFDKFDYADTLYPYSSSYGLTLAHNGKSDNAFVKGLDLKFNYVRFYNDNANVEKYNYGDLQFTAAYSKKLGLITLNPYLRLHNFHNPQAYGAVANDSENTSTVYKIDKLTKETDSYTTIKGGVQLSTEGFAVPTKPSLSVGLAGRHTKFNEVEDATTEFFGYAGITLNEFVFPNNKLSVGYSYYEGHKLGDTAYSPAVGVDNSAFMANSDRVFRGPTPSGATPPWVNAAGNVNVKLDGIYGQWEGWGLKAAYGYFTYTNLNNNNKSKAQAFKVSTNIKF